LGDDDFTASVQPFIDARVGRDTPKAKRRTVGALCDTTNSSVKSIENCRLDRKNEPALSSARRSSTSLRAAITLQT
jgi:hypothetical protein